MKRKIIEINEDLCNGCALCVNACHEHAIQMVNGKAKLVSDIYCDGLGDCLPQCPTGAINMIERDALEYSQEAVDERIQQNKNAAKTNTHATAVEEPLACGCPGTMSKKIDRAMPKQAVVVAPIQLESAPSELTTWPVQLKLVNPRAEYLKGADILVAADCTAFAYSNFHADFVKGRVVLVGCPKLDDNAYYAQKLQEIFEFNEPKSITVVRMEVPCCSGIIQSVKQAMLQSGMIVNYKEVTISIDGKIINR